MAHETCQIQQYRTCYPYVSARAAAAAADDVFFFFFFVLLFLVCQSRDVVSPTNPIANPGLRGFAASAEFAARFGFADKYADDLKNDTTFGTLFGC